MSEPETLRPTERLQRSVVSYWLVVSCLRALFLTTLVWFVGRPLLAAHWRAWSPALEQVLFGVCVAVLVLAVVTPPLSYARWRFGFPGDLLLMRYGILFVEERAVPVRRMQHVDLVRGPVERLFGLATLVVFTAGNEGSAFSVPGLRADRAKELRDRIVQERGDGRL
ncbi:MAG TPA: PH domain-containing protein [Planctomycetota bacterium]|nr:PH domain-containing protein [Planctomycetota bacterium]